MSLQNHPCLFKLTIKHFLSYYFCPSRIFTHTKSAPTHPCPYVCTHKNCEHCLDRTSFLTDMLSPSSFPLPSPPSMLVPTPRHSEHPHPWALVTPTTCPTVCVFAKRCKVKIEIRIRKFSANYCDYSPSPKQPKPPEQFRSRLLTSYMWSKKQALDKVKINKVPFPPVKWPWCNTEPLCPAEPVQVRYPYLHGVREKESSAVLQISSDLHLR